MSQPRKPIHTISITPHTTSSNFTATALAVRGFGNAGGVMASSGSAAAIVSCISFDQ
jgi:hypothetical protein